MTDFPEFNAAGLGGMTDQDKIDDLRSALGALLADLEWHNGRFLSPTQPVSALCNPLTMRKVDEAMEITKS